MWPLLSNVTIQLKLQLPVFLTLKHSLTEDAAFRPCFLL